MVRANRATVLVAASNKSEGKKQKNKKIKIRRQNIRAEIEMIIQGVLVVVP